MSIRSTGIYVSSTTMCPHTTMCVRILLYVSPHTTIYVSSRAHTTIFVSSYHYIRVLIPLYMCPHTTI